MDLVLIRHGAWDPQQGEGKLSRHGAHQADILADGLELRGTVPSLILSSKRGAAKDTALELQNRLAPGVRLTELDALTPRGGPGDLVHLVRQSADLKSADCVFLIGHEGRLSDLLTELTGQRSHPIPHGGAVCVRGADFLDLAAGRGAIHYRYPTVDYQEDQLRSKVNSKMTVASLLAGFVLTALSAVLLLDNEHWPWHRVVAIITLTASLALFLAAVYIYDMLSTPSGFWTDAKPRHLWRWVAARHESKREKLWIRLWNRVEKGAENDDRTRGLRADEDPRFYRLLHDGPVYWLMVQTSRLVFTPAVVLALAGFVALLVGTHDLRIWLGGLIGLLLAAGYAAWRRPDLGAD